MSAIDEYLAFQGTTGFKLFAGIARLNKLDAKEVFFAVRDEVLDAIDGLMRGVRYRSNDLLTDELWAIFVTPGLHKAIGICVSFLVKLGVVPLVCVSTVHESCKWYSLKPLTN